MVRSLHLLVAALMLLLLTSCKRNDSANLLDVIDVAPRDVEVGDVIEVIGTNLPSGDVRDATITFVGTLNRPGQETLTTDGIVVQGAKPTPDKVSFNFTESLQNKFCGIGDAAAHTTFRGNIIVEFRPAAEGGEPVQGTVYNIVLDFRPPSARRVVLQAREEQGRKALAHFGLSLDPEGGPASGGLRILKVRAASPGDKSGIVSGDVIVSFDGVTVKSIADLNPPSGARVSQIGIQRGSAEPVIRQISVAGFEGSLLPDDILGALLILGVAAFILLIFMAPTAGIITWVERRVSARMQSRIGPNRAGPQGFLVWIADGIKSIHKEDIIPTESDQTLFRLAPYLVFIGVSATFVVMPFGQYLIAADLDIGILFVIAVTSLVAIGLLTGGWASNNKWSLLGGVRAAAQVISYEIPAAVSIVCVVMMTGSLRMQEIIMAQGGVGESFITTGGWPWYWYVFRNPVTFPLFFLFFITALAEGNRAPFDLPEAESELIAGYSTEYSGMRYLFFFFAEWANVFVFCGIATALFLGGWQLPGVSPAAQEASLPLQLGGTFLFLLKSWVLIFIVIWIRWTLPRVRIDQLMTLCWKWLVPISFGMFMITALWVMATSTTAGKSPLIPGSVQLIIGIAMFAVWCYVLVFFAKRVKYNVVQSKQPVHLNPFL